MLMLFTLLLFVLCAAGSKNEMDIFVFVCAVWNGLQQPKPYGIFSHKLVLFLLSSLLLIMLSDTRMEICIQNSRHRLVGIYSSAKNFHFEQQKTFRNHSTANRW